MDSVYIKRCISLIFGGWGWALHLFKRPSPNDPDWHLQRDYSLFMGDFVVVGSIFCSTYSFILSTFIVVIALNIMTHSLLFQRWISQGWCNVGL